MNEYGIRNAIGAVKRVDIDVERLREILEREWAQAHQETSVSDYLAEYRNDISSCCENDDTLASLMWKYYIIKSVKALKKKEKYNEYKREAKVREKKDSREDISILPSQSAETQIINILRFIQRDKKLNLDVLMGGCIQRIRTVYEAQLIRHMEFIERYGSLDYMMQCANELASDVYYGSIYPKEEDEARSINVTRSIHYKDLPIQDLLLLGALWEGVYFSDRANIGEIMYIIQKLDDSGIDVKEVDDTMLLSMSKQLLLLRQMLFVKGNDVSESDITRYQEYIQTLQLPSSMQSGDLKRDMEEYMESEFNIFRTFIHPYRNFLTNRSILHRELEMRSGRCSTVGIC